MPWKECAPMDQRIAFVRAAHSGLYPMIELCRDFGVSAKTGYKWLNRYRAGGEPALHDQSRAPKSSPHRMDPAIAELLIQTRLEHPTWSAKKIRRRLIDMDPQLNDVLPKRGAAHNLFVRHGLVASRKRRRQPSFDVAGALKADAPNEVWTADFKGEFRLRNGTYCYPFTLADAYSRFILSCQAEESTSLLGAQRALVDAFRRYGLPRAIRTDNGTPFVGHGLSGLSTLGVWWIKLGIRHDRIAKGRPDQNGRHERMHRTLKAEATRPPQSSFAEQQLCFDAFLHEFNQERPHEALDLDTPGSRYRPSPREYVEPIPRPEYPGHYERRKISANGSFKFKDHRYFLAHPLAGEWLGLVEIDEDVWVIRFYDCELGRINPRNGDYFIKVLPMSMD